MYVHSWANLNAWSGVVYQSLCLLLYKKLTTVYISKHDTLTTQTNEVTWSHKLTGWLECYGGHGQTSTSEKWNTIKDTAKQQMSD